MKYPNLIHPLKPWLVCFAAGLFFFYNFVQMTMFNTIGPSLMHDFSINATRLGKFSSYYFRACLIFVPISGYLLDRFSVRSIILSTLSLCIVSTLAFAYTKSFFLASLFRFSSGISSAFCFLGSVRLVSRWFPEKSWAFVISLIIAMAMLGGLVAQKPMILLVEQLGWRHTLLSNVLLGSLILLLIAFWVSDKPKTFPTPPSLKQKPVGLLASLRLTYLNTHNCLCGLYTCLMNLPIVLLGSVWGIAFLQQAAGFEAVDAASGPSMLFIGTLIGGPIIGRLSDRVGKRILFMVLGAFLALPLGLILAWAPILSLKTYSLLFFGLGFMTSTQVLSYALVGERNPPHLTAASVSVVSFLTMSGYVIFQPLFGLLMDWPMTDSLKTAYTFHDYQHALWLLPSAFLIALLITCFLQEKTKI